MLRNMAELELIQGRFKVARAAVEAVGAALMFLRGKDTSGWQSFGGQLKTPVDKAAEAWILEYIRSFYPTDRILAEESFEEKGECWDAPSAFWSVDALDGTRSFVEGFGGFCTQVAYIHDCAPLLGVIHEPVRKITYWAIRGYGAYKQHLGGKPQKLCLPLYSSWPSQSVFVDSTYPRGPVGQLLKINNGKFLECGSIGLKICRVADGEAHVFAKALTFKIWDVAPGQLILTEAGGKLALWGDLDILYNTQQVYFDDLVAASEGLFPLVVQQLSKLTSREA